MEGIKMPREDLCVGRCRSGHREKLPSRRASHTVKFTIGGQTCYLTCGEYEDGRLGEVFVVASKVGSALRSFVDAWAIMVSKSLQYGVPLEEIVETFRDYRFEPNGSVIVDVGEGQEPFPITRAASILDFIVRYVAVVFLKDGASTFTTIKLEQL